MPRLSCIVPSQTTIQKINVTIALKGFYKKENFEDNVVTVCRILTAPKWAVAPRSIVTHCDGSFHRRNEQMQLNQVYTQD